MEDCFQVPPISVSPGGIFYFVNILQNTIFCLKKKEERLVIEVNNLSNAMETIRQLTTFLLKSRRAKSTAFWGQTELVNLRL